MAGKNLIGTKLKMNHPATTQVFQATHNGEGARLPLRYRSFISFTWGGKNIEDFNLIATINGDRMSGGLYSAFEDLTSDYEVMDGHFYWGTHFTDNEKEFRLATDAITEQQLQDFIHWFQPGITRELVLAEHPNRAIYARLSAAPSYSLLPFEHTSEFKIKKKLYTTSQTVYRGEISLTFVMEEPYWHSINNVIQYYYTDEENKFGSMTDDYTLKNKKLTAQDDDFLKVIVEDGIPHIEMFRTPAILGDRTYAAVQGTDESGIDSAIVATWKAGENNPPYAMVGEKLTSISEATDGAKAGNMVGKISKASGLTLYQESTPTVRFQEQFLYYCGTAPAYTIMEFDLKPYIGNEIRTMDYILFPKNTYPKNYWDEPYHYISFIPNGDASAKYSFYFTISSIFMSYNQAIQIIKETKNTDDLINIKQKIRDTLGNYYTRAWALFCLQCCENNASSASGITDNKITNSNIFQSFFCKFMRRFICNGEQEDIKNEQKTPTEEGVVMRGVEDSTPHYFTHHFSFNSKTGEALGTFHVREAPVIQISTGIQPADVEIYNVIEITENVGDMVKSPFIFLKERNLFDENGLIGKNFKKENSNSPYNQENLTRIRSDYRNTANKVTVGGLTNFMIEFKNMYL